MSETIQSNLHTNEAIRSRRNILRNKPSKNPSRHSRELSAANLGLFRSTWNQAMRRLLLCMSILASTCSMSSLAVALDVGGTVGGAAGRAGGAVGGAVGAV